MHLNQRVVFARLLQRSQVSFLKKKPPFGQDDKKEQDICQNVMIKSDWVSDWSEYEENPNDIGAHTCELKNINGAKLKAFGL